MILSSVSVGPTKKNMPSLAKQKKAARLLVLMSNSENLRLLKSVLDDDYEIVRELGEFDLCIVDTMSMPRVEAWLRKCKAENFNVFLPVLGLISTPDVTHLFNQKCDEVIKTPCTKFELQRRVEMLLKVRELSVQNYLARDDLNERIGDLETEGERLKVSEHRARASSQQMMVLSDTMPQMVWTADVDGAIDYLNERWYLYTLTTPEEISQFGFSKVIHPSELVAWNTEFTQAISSGNPLQVEHRFLGADSQYRWFLVRALPLIDESGNVTHWFGTCTDIHDQKNLQEELSAATVKALNLSDTKSAFLANMSHEIRTPLAAILGFTDLLEEENLPQHKQKQFIDVIKRNGKALATLIDDILDLSKVEAGKIQLEKLEFSLDELVDEVMTIFTEKAKTKGLLLQLLKDPKLQPKIISDPVRLRQVLVNLIGNAVKFTDSGSVTIIPQFLGYDSDDHAQIEIAVIDTGIGLTSEQEKKLFEPFMQADNSTTRKFGGTGLGLALSKRLAEALGGDVSIRKSGLNEGSTFVLHFVAGVSDPM